MQEQGIDYQVFAPVVRYEAIWALLAVSVSDEMYVHQMDVIGLCTRRAMWWNIYGAAKDIGTKWTKGQSMYIV